MIAVSYGLVAVAAALLVGAVVAESVGLIIASVVTSILALLVLATAVIRHRRQADEPAADRGR